MSNQDIDLLSSFPSSLVTPSEDDSFWYIGAIIYMTGSIFINLGSNIISYSHIRALKSKKKKWCIKIYWFVGFVIFFSGNIFNFAGFMFAAQSLLVALGSIQFVSNLFFARVINKEPITKRAFIATFIIVGGNVLIVLFGNKNDETYDLEQLKELLIQTPFIVYCGFVVLSVILLQISYTLVDKVFKEKIPEAFSHRYLPFAYAAISALIGTISVSIGKAISGFFKLWIDGVANYFNTFWPYLFLLFAILTTIFWLYRMNVALKLYDAMFIIPVLQALWLLFGVLAGGIFFEEFQQLSVLNNCMFALGISILLCGVALLSPATKTAEENVIEDVQRSFNNYKNLLKQNEQKKKLFRHHSFSDSNHNVYDEDNNVKVVYTFTPKTDKQENTQDDVNLSLNYKNKRNSISGNDSLQYEEI